MSFLNPKLETKFNSQQWNYNGVIEVKEKLIFFLLAYGSKQTVESWIEETSDESCYYFQCDAKLTARVDQKYNDNRKPKKCIEFTYQKITYGRHRLAILVLPMDPSGLSRYNFY